jgi:hypothetical protein
MAIPFADVALRADRKRGQRQPQEVLIRQREYEHDTAVLTMSFDSKTRAQYRSGAPVTISWGWLPDDVEFFFGYVHHSQQVQKTAHVRLLKVYVVGASWRMNTKRTASYFGRVHDLASRVARLHRFSLLCDLDKAAPRRFVQAGRTDFKMLTDEAKRSGMSMYVNKTDVVMTRRATERSSRQRTVFRYEPSRRVQRNTIYSIKHAVGEAIPGTERRRRTAYGVTDDGQVIKSTDLGVLEELSGHRAPARPVFGKFLGRPVTSLADAQSQLVGERDLHRFHITAAAEVSGSAKVHQASTVRFVDLDDDSDGLWFVRGVEHRITREDYRMTLDVARDSLGDVDAPANGGEPVQTSVSGKPVLVSGCDLGVDQSFTAAPGSIYSPLDDCVPVQAVELDPLGDPVSSPITQSPGRRIVTGRKPRPSRPRGVATPNQSAQVSLRGWRATTTITRVRS